MKLPKVLTILLLMIFCNSFAQRSFLSYYDLRNYMQASPGAFKFGLYGYENPAMTTLLHDFDMMFSLSSKIEGGKISGFQNWGLLTGSPNSGFGLISTSDSVNTVVDYRYSFSFGDRSFAIGIGYGFSGGDKGAFGRSNLFNLGLIARPFPFLSIGATSTIALAKNEYEVVAELALKPVPDYMLTIFGDYGMFNDQNLRQGTWSGGFSWEFLDGLRLNGRYFSDKTTTIGLDISFGSYGISALTGIENSTSELISNTYNFRLGASDRSILKDLLRGQRRFSKLDLTGGIKYQKFMLFDNSRTLLGILQQLDAVKKNESLEGILINATNLSANREMLWEIREKLKEFKESGKKIVIFIERANIDMYHFASIADKIIIDPLGMIMLEGYLIGRSYYKNLLTNIGVGFEEIRLFKYKSAAESFARDKMSEADREQNQKIIEDWYELTRSEVCASRKISYEIFDSLVNDNLVYMADDAQQLRLIDTMGRWVNADEIAKVLFGNDINITTTSLDEMNTNPFQPKKPQPIDNKWGIPLNKIAIVYAKGVCAMDFGINARKLVEDLKDAMEDESIQAVVLRVDSPGGDAMASDYIADVLRKFKNKKPIIVSQGWVAASGGYWLSMDADAIVSSPMTITGSIGVIGSFLYDKGLKDSIGITTDIVKIGKYADLGYPFVLPFIPIGLPVRNLTEDERSKIESRIMQMYKDFVGKVAKGRNKKYEEIEQIAQGRIWSGIEGKKIGIVDEIGGLEKAIMLAKEKANIPFDEDCIIEEYPALGWFDFSSLLNLLFGIRVETENELLNTFKILLKNNTTPMPILPIDYWGEEVMVH